MKILLGSSMGSGSWVHRSVQISSSGAPIGIVPIGVFGGSPTVVTTGCSVSG